MRYRIGHLLRLWEIRREMLDDLQLWMVAFFHKNCLYRVPTSTEVCMESGEGWPLLFASPSGGFFKVDQKGRWRKQLIPKLLTRQDAITCIVGWFDPVEAQMLIDLYGLAEISAG